MITLTKQDIQRLQWAIALFVALSVAGAFIVNLAIKTHRDASEANQQAEQSRQEARGRASRARDEEEELRQKIAAYQGMVASGVVGQEHRLDWIESIRRIKHARKLLDVRYEIGPQEPVKADVVAPSLNGFEIMASPMKLDMQLLHENDLLGFLADLRPQVKGYVRLNQCSVTRAANAASTAASNATSPQGPAPQLQASCGIDWITIRERR